MKFGNRVRLKCRAHGAWRLVVASLMVCFIAFINGHVALAGTMPPTLEESANNGDPDAQFKLGTSYLNGEGHPKDTTKALLWLTYAGINHHGPAQLSLGVVYFHGWGVPADPLSAKYWFIRASQSGLRDAQYYLEKSELSLASPMADHAAQQHTSNQPTHDIHLGIFGKIRPAR